MPVLYRLREPETWTPPPHHDALEDDTYATLYDPELELLDELGIITVDDWGP